MSFPPAQCHLYLFSLGNFEIEELFWRKGSGGGMGSRWVFLFFFLEVRGISSWGGGILCVPVGPLRRAELRAACDPGGARGRDGNGEAMLESRSKTQRSAGPHRWELLAKGRARGAGSGPACACETAGRGADRNAGRLKNRRREGRKAPRKDFHAHKKQGEGFVTTCPPTHGTLRCSEPAGAVRAGR